MTSYTTLDYLPDLTINQMSGAVLLNLLPVPIENAEWDNIDSVIGDKPHAIAHSIYQFVAKEGATYDVSSSSYFDPFDLRIYDNKGNVIQANNESDDPGFGLGGEVDEIHSWIAPYTGTYYVDASWHQQIGYFSIYELRILEDIDTAITGVDTMPPAVTTSLAESYLSKYGITIQQANDFILSHVNEPLTIFNTAKQFGVTTLMLGEITGYSTSDITTYFASFGLDTALLDTSTPDNTGAAGNHELLAQDMTSFVKYIEYNNNTGALSTTSLREQVLGAGITESQYFSLFDPKNFKGSEDGVFTPEETGITSLGNISATVENIESLFYGATANLLGNLDYDEVIPLISYFDNSFDPKTDGADLAGYPQGFRVNAINSYNDPAQDPLFNNDELLSISIVSTVISELQLLGNNDTASLFDGILYSL